MRVKHRKLESWKASRIVKELIIMKTLNENRNAVKLLIPNLKHSNMKLVTRHLQVALQTAVKPC